MTSQDFEKIRQSYLSSAKRLLLLDYEGTLLARDTKGNQNIQVQEIADTLLMLARDQGNSIVVMSKQSREKLTPFVAELPVSIAAENGGIYRTEQREWKALSDKSPAWKEDVHRGLATVAKHYPGSTIEMNHHSLHWYYDSAEVQISDTEKRQLQVALRAMAKQHHLILHDDGRMVEFATPGISKAAFAAHWVADYGPYDFILALGDDATDEELFQTIGNNYVTIKLGNQKDSFAQFTLASQKEVLHFLNNLATVTLK